MKSWSVATYITLLFVFAFLYSIFFGGADAPSPTDKPLPEHSARLVPRAKPAPPPKPAADKDHVPANWQEFVASTYPEDKTNVAYVKKLAARTDGAECREWGKGMRQKTITRRTHTLREYLIDQKEINGIDLVAVQYRRPAIGMSSCGLLATMGSADRVHRHNYAGSESLQIVYEREPNTVYVHMDWTGNGFILTSFSD